MKKTTLPTLLFSTTYDIATKQNLERDISGRSLSKQTMNILMSSTTDYPNISFNTNIFSLQTKVNFTKNNLNNISSTNTNFKVNSNNNFFLLLAIHICIIVIGVGWWIFVFRKMCCIVIKKLFIKKSNTYKVNSKKNVENSNPPDFFRRYIEYKETLQPSTSIQMTENSFVSCIENENYIEIELEETYF